jgi:Flp pilus assembly CpaF family ATPase
MTAMSSGGRPSGIPNPLSSASERPHADQSLHSDQSRARDQSLHSDQSHARDQSRPRPLDQIFPMQGDANRTREMQAAWRSFCRDRLEAVRGVLEAGRSPPEIAYQLGELLHNHFRTRGVTLTSYELRRLVAELLSLHDPNDGQNEPRPTPAPVTSPPLPAPPVPAAPPVVAVAPEPPARKEPPPKPLGAPRPRAAAPPAVVPVVAFEREPRQPWPGDEPQAPSPAVAEKALEPPPSPIVKVVPREPAPLERLLSRAIDLAKGRSAPPRPEPVRAVVEEAPAPSPPPPPATPSVSAAPAPPETPPAPMPEKLVEKPPVAVPEKPAAAASSEMARMGLIDRLWADRSIQAIFVNGAQSVFIERGGALHAVKEVFRDEAHLAELVARLVGRPDSGMADFQLRDGTTGFVVLPPHAPSGPALTMRRADPGRATLDKLVAEGAIHRTVAELLQLGARGRLNMLVTGPQYCGKTALLVALVRDLEPSVRVVTVAGHRHFAWPMASKVELVAAAPVSIAKLIPPAAKLEPGLLVMDDMTLQDVAALAERLLRGAPGTLAALGPEAMSEALTRSVDLVARIDRGSDGVFRVVTVEDSAGAMIFRHENGKLVRGTTTPAFAPTLQARGQGLALSKLLA